MLLGTPNRHVEMPAVAGCAPPWRSDPQPVPHVVERSSRLRHESHHPQVSSWCRPCGRKRWARVGLPTSTTTTASRGPRLAARASSPCRRPPLFRWSEVACRRRLRGAARSAGHVTAVPGCCPAGRRPSCRAGAPLDGSFRRACRRGCRRSPGRCPPAGGGSPSAGGSAGPP